MALAASPPLAGTAGRQNYLDWVEVGAAVEEEIVAGRDLLVQRLGRVDLDDEQLL